MITTQEARKKLNYFTGLPATDPLHMTPYVYEIFCSILDGNSITLEHTWTDPGSPQYVTWLERRLSSSHLKYLTDMTQVNDKWGIATTKALVTLIDTYKLKNTLPTLNQQTLIALLDGTLGAQQKDKTLYQQIRDAVVKKYSWSDDSMRMNLVGIRGFLLPKASINNIPNEYNDTFFVCYRDYKGNEKAIEYVCSVDPGYYYYKINPLNPMGCAHLAPGQYLYGLGTHRYYEALVQNSAVTIYRSNDGNYKKSDPKTKGWYGINIHAGTPGPAVYNASAGCQVLQCMGPYSELWLSFMVLIKQDPVKQYKYTLLDRI